jgi:hypothetical protein
VHFCTGIGLGYAVGDRLIVPFLQRAYQSYLLLAQGEFLAFCAFSFSTLVSTLLNLLLLAFLFFIHRIYLFPDFRAHISEKWQIFRLKRS